MLLKSHISKIEMFTLNSNGEYNAEWKAAHLGVFSSSENFNLTGETFLTKGCKSYIYRKVGEEMTGLPAKDDISTPAIEHGNFYEIEALWKFREIHGIPTDYKLPRQVFIRNPETRFGCTPDLLIPQQDYEDSVEVVTVEAKCPKTYDSYLSLFMCQTPLDLKKAEPKHYWQVLDQMDNCGAIVGWYFIYQPHFKVGGYHQIKFRLAEKFNEKFVLVEDLKLLRERKAQAEREFNRIRDLLLKN